MMETDNLATLLRRQARMAEASASRADLAHHALREALRAGLLAPGERVREDEIAAALGISRTPVREALHRMQARGLLDAAGRGLAVARLDRRQVLELYEMREILEGTAARLAARHAAEAELTLLDRLAAASAAAGAGPEAAAANRRFHRAMQEAAHNRYLLQTLDELDDAIALLGPTTLAEPGRAAAAAGEHAAILAAIVARDADRAEALARAHIRGARDARLLMAEAAR